jgi:hypothetical protein
MRASIAVMFALAVAGTSRGEPATYASRVAPIFERSCTGCHGANRQKADLRLDSHAAILRGAPSGLVIKPGDAKASEIYHRITLPATDEDVMPSDGKPLLPPHEIALLEKWIIAGAPATEPFDAPPLVAAKVEPQLAPDYSGRLAEAEAVSRSLGFKLMPRSRVVTDGLVVRTAGAPARCDDTALAKLAPFADLITEAELARTRITDGAMASIASWPNLRAIDVSRTAVSSSGIIRLAELKKLERINVSSTRVDAAALEELRKLPSLQRLWSFSEATASDAVTR